MTLLNMMLLPFLMSEHTSFLSSNAIAAMFNCALKVAVIAFLSSVGLSAMGRYFDELGKSFLTLQWQTMLIRSLLNQRRLPKSLTILVHLFPKT